MLQQGVKNIWTFCLPGRIFQCVLSAKIVIKGRQNSNLFKLLEHDTDHMARKSYVVRSAFYTLLIWSFWAFKIVPDKLFEEWIVLVKKF